MYPGLVGRTPSASVAPPLVQWPSACAGEHPAEGQSGGEAAAFRTISEDASIRGLVEGEARQSQTRIACYLPEVVDESQWDLGDD